MKELWKKFKGSAWFRKWVYKPYETRSFSSVKEMMDADRFRGHLYEIYFYTKCRLVNIWNWPGDRIRDLKHYHQRGIHGVSNCDCWGLFDYLLDVKIRGLKYIKEYKHGCPCLDGFGGEHDGEQTEEEFEAMSKEWDRIVDEMIWTFETTKKMSGHEIYAPNGDSYFTEEQLVRAQKFCDEMNVDYPKEGYRVLTKGEFERYKQGWQYYVKHFFSLWD